MQLAVLDVIKENGSGPASFRRLIDDVRDLTAFVRSSAARSKFADRQGGNPKTLLTDSPTRWLSAYDMLERFCELYPVLEAMAINGELDDFDGTFLQQRYVTKIADFVQALKPCADFVRLAEGEKYATLALVPVLLARCLAALDYRGAGAVAASVNATKSELASKIRRRLGHILTTVNMALCAAALHPEYGHLGFVDVQVKRDVRAELEEWGVSYGRLANTSSVAGGYELPNSRASRGVIQQQLAELFAMFDARRPDDPLALADSTKDPLAFWRALTRQHSPALKPLVQMLFCVYATSAPTERVFSGKHMRTHAIALILCAVTGTGAFDTEKRNRLGADKLEMLAMIRSFAKDLSREKLAQFRASCAKEFAERSNKRSKQ